MFGPTRPSLLTCSLDQAVLSFQWRFDAVSERRTRITQRILLSGDNAATYSDQVHANFGVMLGDGMKRISDAMMRAEALNAEYAVSRLLRLHHHVALAMVERDSGEQR